MLRYSLGQPDAALAIDEAVRNTIEAGVTTKDIGGSASTSEVGDAIAKELQRVLSR